MSLQTLSFREAANASVVAYSYCTFRIYLKERDMTLNSFENHPHDKTLKLTGAFSLLMKEINPHDQIERSESPRPTLISNVLVDAVKCI
jgi:hypothetical protein